VTLVSGTDTNTVGGMRVFQMALVDVRVVSDGVNYANAIADRVDTVIQNAAGTKEAVNVVELRRDQVTAFVENDAGKLYSHIVSSYRTEAYA
jgi:hypothetical protein